MQAKLALERLGKKIMEADKHSDAEAQLALRTVITRVQAKESMLIRASMTRKSMSRQARAAAINEKQYPLRQAPAHQGGCGCLVFLLLMVRSIRSASIHEPLRPG